jgi:hypothetical protein
VLVKDGINGKVFQEEEGLSGLLKHLFSNSTEWEISKNGALEVHVVKSGSPGLRGYFGRDKRKVGGELEEECYPSNSTGVKRKLI